MIVKLLTEHHLEFLSLTGGCRGSFESTLVKMSNCWRSQAAAHLESFKGQTYCFLTMVVVLVLLVHCPEGKVKSKILRSKSLSKTVAFIMTFSNLKCMEIQ